MNIAVLWITAIFGVRKVVRHFVFLRIRQVHYLLPCDWINCSMCCFSGRKVVDCPTHAFLEVVFLCSFVIIISLYVYLRGKVISVTENPRTMKCDCSKMVGEVSLTDLLRGKSCPIRKFSCPFRYLLHRTGHLKLKVFLPEFHRSPPPYPARFPCLSWDPWHQAWFTTAP